MVKPQTPVKVNLNKVVASIKAKFSNKKSPKASSADYLVVGLGNPGSKYDGTRHNIGADVVRAICEANNVTLGKAKAKAVTAGIAIGQTKIALAVPTTYMNESGIAVGELARWFGITDPFKIVIIHDELDLPVGAVRIKLGGGFAGHNGLKSINQHLKSPEFLRVRVGIDRPEHPGAVSKYVLSKPGSKEKRDLQVGLVEAVSAIELIATQGFEQAMQQTNSRK